MKVTYGMVFVSCIHPSVSFHTQFLILKETIELIIDIRIASKELNALAFDWRQYDLTHEMGIPHHMTRGQRQLLESQAKNRRHRERLEINRMKGDDKLRNRERTRKNRQMVQVRNQVHQIQQDQQTVQYSTTGPRSQAPISGSSQQLNIQSVPQTNPEPTPTPLPEERNSLPRPNEERDAELQPISNRQEPTSANSSRALETRNQSDQVDMVLKHDHWGHHGKHFLCSVSPYSPRGKSFINPPFRFWKADH